MNRFLCASTFVLFVLLGAQAIANTVLAVGPDLVVNGVIAIRFPKLGSGTAPELRAISAAHRIKHLPYWGQVTVRGDGTGRSVSIGPDEVVSVTPTDAAFLNTTVPELATSWAVKLQDAMNLPPLKVSDNFVQIPIGKSKNVSVIGSMAGKATAQTSDPKIATVVRSGSGFSIKGVGVGSAIVSVTFANYQENVQVTVEPYAVVLPQSFEVSVTGYPATAETVKGAAEMAIRTRLQILPDAHVLVSSPVVSSLDPGKSASFTFGVAATSPTGIANKGLATVTVDNLAWPKRTDDFLWYSNKPETVKRSQSLFSASLKRGNSVRFLYHHLNGTMNDIFFRVEIVNDGKLPAQVSIIPGDSAPNIDPVNAGIAAASQFFRGWVAGSAEIITIPAGSVLPISLRRLSPGETGSGLCELRLMSGSQDVLVRADSLPPLQLDDKWSGVLFSSTPWHDVGTHPVNMYDNIPSEANSHVYADPYQQNTLSYTVGGRYGFYRIGQRPLSQVDQGGSLDGNYGVLDTIQTTLANPTANPADVELVFEASAGYAGAIFLVNGEVRVIKQLRPKDTAQIAKFHLSPGETITVPVTTIPLSGSSYPATIIARPILAF